MHKEKSMDAETIYFSFLDKEKDSTNTTKGLESMEDFHLLQDWKKEPRVEFNVESGQGYLLISLYDLRFQEDFEDFLRRLYNGQYTIWKDNLIETSGYP
jgi:asparagine synthetase A